jgi:cytochrome c-type biogenesis protein CcmH/NrfG
MGESNNPPALRRGAGGWTLNRNLLSGLLIGVFAGFLAGYFVGASRSGDDVPPPMPAAAVPGGLAMPPKPNPMEVQQRIAGAQAALVTDPKNVQAWISLGNDYYDTQQFQSSVDAYAKALALEPDNADVLTDQGTMYRQLKSFDKAIANFKRAQKLNPQHVQSLYNLGVVYAEDLKDLANARKSWNQLLEQAPGSPQAAQAKAALAAMAPAKP